MDVLSLLQLAKSKGASDLHLLVSTPPVLRIDGSLRPESDMAPVTPEDIDQALEQVTSVKERSEFHHSMELDFGYTCPDVGRVRCNAARQRGTTSLVFRLLPQTIPGLEELGLPDVCRELVGRPRGMVVVSGPTGSGKSTTLAAMIRHLNQHASRRIVTIEDPIEFVHLDDRCAISQREIGTDTTSFAEALKRALRQDPDIILVGEMRDFETASAALTIADTGHLVLTTGHAPSAYQAVERVIDLFPPDERHLAQSRLASLLVGVLCQTLVPKADGPGRVAAVEIMLANPAVRNLIREGKTYQIPNLIRTHAREGMQLLDQALVNLYKQRKITRQSAFGFCNDPEQVEKLIGSQAPDSPAHSLLAALY